MATKIEGHLSAKGKNFAIVVSRFNEVISKSLLAGAVDCIQRHEGEDKNITIAYVPGAYEIPVVAKRMAVSKNMMLLYV